MTSPSSAVELLDAICSRDFDRATASLSESASLRALLPPRFLEAEGADEIVGWFRRWFEQAETFTVVDRDAGEVGGRNRLTWRFQLAPHPSNGDGTLHEIEQTLFCDVEDGKIQRIDLLCSGFRQA
jgi:hypothetical protein